MLFALSNNFSTINRALLWSWAGTPLKNSLRMSLKQWSSSRSGCLRKILQMGKNAFFSEELKVRTAGRLFSLPAESKTLSSLNDFKKSIKS